MVRITKPEAESQGQKLDFSQKGWYRSVKGEPVVYIDYALGIHTFVHGMDGPVSGNDLTDLYVPIKSATITVTVEE